MTVGMLCSLYLEHDVKVRRPDRQRQYTYQLNPICRTVLTHPDGTQAAFRDWLVSEVTPKTLEQYRQARCAEGLRVVAADKSLELLRTIFNWALRVGHVVQSPFKRNGESVIKFSHYPKRDRRLAPEEEPKLLSVADVDMCDVIEAALATGMRRNEILSLQWHQVGGLAIEAAGKIVWQGRAEIVLPANKTKTRMPRRIPISERLKPILARRRFDPDGSPMPADRYVFGSGIGERIGDVTFTNRWMSLVLKAHGFKRVFTANALGPGGYAELQRINLHFHDLRREAASRWLEGGVPIHTVRDWLGPLANCADQHLSRIIDADAT